MSRSDRGTTVAVTPLKVVSTLLAPGVDLPVPDAADLILLKLAAGGALDLRDAAALLATDRERLVSAVESRLAAAAVGLDATACWRQVLALPA